MINNIDAIKPLLQFPKKGDSFYFIQVLQRKKDHKGIMIGGSNNNSRLIKAYQIESIDYLDIHFEEMVKLAELFNARVGIIIAQLETKNGYHLITNPFNLMEFSKRYPDIEVHKNNPTCLYIP